MSAQRVDRFTPLDLESYRFGCELDKRTHEADIDWHEARRFWRALMLAPGLETLEAILDGDDLDLDRLDPRWLAAFRGHLP